MQRQWVKIFFFIIVIFLSACGNDSAKSYKVGIINVAKQLENSITGFKQGMTQLGYIEGKTITYLYNGATLDLNSLEKVAEGLVAADVDLILSITTPGTLAVKKATAQTDIPVVFVAVTDPLGANIVNNIRHPGRNITGITFGPQETRRLEWLVRISPGIKKIYIPYNPLDPSPVLALAVARKTAEKLGVELITRQFKDSAELDKAIEIFPRDVDAVFLLPDSLVSTRIADFTSTAIRLKIPVSGANIEAVRSQGALVSYGSDLIIYGSQGARLADQIFRGVKPADLPVETAELFLAVNLNVAKAIGIEIPDTILSQVDIIVR